MQTNPWLMILCLLMLLVMGGVPAVDWQVARAGNLPRASNSPPGLPGAYSPANGYLGARLVTELNVQVSDPDGDDLTVTFYGRPKQTKPPTGNFSLVLLPDTQYYTTQPGGGAIFQAQTQWIVDQRLNRNIVFVSHLGDVVETGNYDTDKSEWNIADTAMQVLEMAPGVAGGIPYAITTGNHDVVGGGSLFEQYFGVNRFTTAVPQPRPYYGGHYGSDNRNNYAFFGAGEMGFIVINLDTSVTPPVEVLKWAERLLRLNIQRRAIIVSHVLLYPGTPAAWLFPGDQVYEALKDNPNLFLMLCGHLDSEVQRQDTFEGNTVYSLMSDYQLHPNGGDGWLRIMTFSDAFDQIQVETYSPSLNSYATDADSQFTLPYPMRDDLVILGARSNIASGESTSVIWANLTPGTEYEWFVTVDDGNLITLGPRWGFTTQDPSVIGVTSVQAHPGRVIGFWLIAVVVGLALGTVKFIRKNVRK